MGSINTTVLVKMLRISDKDEGRPIEWMRMLVADRQHRRPEGERFCGSFLPFSIKMHHQGGGGFIIHIPQAQEKRPGTGIQKSAHEAEQVVAAGDLAYTRLA